MNQPAKIKKTGEEVSIIRLSAFGQITVKYTNRPKIKGKHQTGTLRRCAVENL